MKNKLNYLTLIVGLTIISCNPSDDPILIGKTFTRDKDVLGSHYFYTLNKDGSYNPINYSEPTVEAEILDVFAQLHQFVYTINRVSFTSETACKLYLNFTGTTDEIDVEATYTLNDKIITLSLLGNISLWKIDENKNTIAFCSSVFYGNPVNSRSEVIYDENCLSLDPVEICKQYVAPGKYITNDTFGVYYVDEIFK